MTTEEGIVLRRLLKVDGVVYNEQPRWFDYDYHPQKIKKINDDSIEVFEEGYSPNGKSFTIPINRLHILNDTYIIH